MKTILLTLCVATLCAPALAQDAAEFRKQGNLAAREERWADVVAAYEKARPAFEKDADFLNQFANAHSHLARANVQPLKNFSEAGKLYNAAIRLDQNNADFRSNLGFNWLGWGDWETDVALKKISYLRAVDGFQKAISLGRDNHSNHYWIGTALFRLDKYAEAESEARKSLSLAPKSDLSQSLLGQILSRQGKYAEAEAPLRSAYALDPKNPSHAVNLRALLLKLGKPEEAKPSVTEAPAPAPQTTAPAAIAAKLNQASVLLQKRDAPAARRLIDEALALAPDNFEALLFQALAQYLQDTRTSRMQASVAFSIFTDRSDAFPTTPRFLSAAKAVCAVVDPGSSNSAKLSLQSLKDGVAALYYQREGEMLLLREESGTAEFRLRQAIEARPERSSLHALLAEALAQQGKATEVGKSRAEAARLLAKNPGGDLKPSPVTARAWADSEEGDAAFFAKDYRKAVASYARAESVFARDPRFLGSFGQSYEELARSGASPQENFDRAIALFEKYDALEPGNASLLDLLARALLSRAELASDPAKSAPLRERARVVLAKKQALMIVAPTPAPTPVQDPAALRKQGDAALAAKRWADAIAAYEKARPAFEKDAMFLDALGDAHYYLGKEKIEPQKHFSEAQKLYEAATRIQPGTAFIWAQLGHAWEETGELENAVVAYQKSLSLSAIDPWVHRALGGVLYKLQRYPETELRLREAVRIKPNTEEFYNELGMACVAQTKWREAEAAYREAFRVNKNNPAYPNNIAAALVRQGKPEEARPFAEQARRLKLSGDTPAPKKLVFKNGAQLLNALLEMQKNIQDVNARSASTRALKNILTNVEALESKGNSKVIRKISSDSLKEVLPEFFGLFLTKQEFALVSLTTLNTFPKVAERPADSLAKLVREVRTLKANVTVPSKDNEPSPLEYALRDIEMQGKTWPDKEREQVEKALKDLLQVLQDAMQVSEAARDWVERSL